MLQRMVGLPRIMRSLYLHRAVGDEWLRWRDERRHFRANGARWTSRDGSADGREL